MISGGIGSGTITFRRGRFAHGRRGAGPVLQAKTLQALFHSGPPQDRGRLRNRAIGRPSTAARGSPAGRVDPPWVEKAIFWVPHQGHIGAFPQRRKKLWPAGGVVFVSIFPFPRGGMPIEISPPK